MTGSAAFALCFAAALAGVGAVECSSYTSMTASGVTAAAACDAEVTHCIRFQMGTMITQGCDTDPANQGTTLCTLGGNPTSCCTSGGTTKMICSTSDFSGTPGASDFASCPACGSASASGGSASGAAAMGGSSAVLALALSRLLA